MESVCGMSKVWLLVGALGVLPLCDAALTIVYMPTSCGVVTSVSPSVQLESATGMTYTNNMNCNVSFTVASPYVMLVNIRRFELEPKYSGICNDYVNLHDGGDVNSATLNSDVLCGNSLTNSTYVTSGQQLTVHFVTDSAAVYLGFGIIVTAVTSAPCGGTEYQCNSTSHCIDSTLRCDNYEQCGDGSDELDCSTISSDSGTNWTPVIVGVVLGLLAAALLLTFVLYRRYRRNRWRRFADDHVTHDDLPGDLDPPGYPVTHKYFRGIRGHPAPDSLPRSYEAVVEKEGGKMEEGEPGEKRERMA